MWNERRLSDESGAALITAMLAVIILGGAAVALVATGISQTQAVGQATDFEQAVHLAESGADVVVAQVNANPNYTTTSAPVTGDERAWALSQRPATMPVTQGRGYAYGVRSSSRPGAVYGVGSVDGRREHVRVVKYTLTSDPFTAGQGLLTGGNLLIEGNAVISGSGAGAHSNGNLRLDGNAVIEGDATASGTYQRTGNAVAGTNSGAGRPVVPIPQFTARTFYSLHTSYPDQWVDLCPDGKIRRPAATGPCTGTQIPGSTWNGWRLESGSWKLKDRSTTGPNAVVYICGRNAEVEGNTSQTVTVIVEQAAAGSCGLTSAGTASNSGNVKISGNTTLRAHMGGVQIVADRDLLIEGNTTLYGFLGAGEQIAILGNSSLGVSGAVIARGVANASSKVIANILLGNAKIHYDGGLTLPITMGNRVGTWNEL